MVSRPVFLCDDDEYNGPFPSSHSASAASAAAAFLMHDEAIVRAPTNRNATGTRPPCVCVCLDFLLSLIVLNLPPRIEFPRSLHQGAPSQDGGDDDDAAAVG